MTDRRRAIKDRERAGVVALSGMNSRQRQSERRLRGLENERLLQDAPRRRDALLLEEQRRVGLAGGAMARVNLQRGEQLLFGFAHPAMVEKQRSAPKMALGVVVRRTHALALVDIRLGRQFWRRRRRFRLRRGGCRLWLLYGFLDDRRLQLGRQ